MSQKQLQRVKVIENGASGRLSVREDLPPAALSERQAQRPKRRFPAIPRRDPAGVNSSTINIFATSLQRLRPII
jgi:hypothetical protein